MEKIIKTLTFEIKDMNDEERAFTAVASTEDVDRDGDRIMAAGWALDNFKKNPVVPWSHNYSEPPVARAADIWVEEGRLMFKPKFPSPGDYPFADTIWKLYRGGFLRAFSVGFRPTRRELVERSKGVRGYDFIEQELWEISACTVPSNPNALVAAKSAGIITEDEAALVAKVSPDPSHPTDPPHQPSDPGPGTQDPGPLSTLLADVSRNLTALSDRLAGLESAVAALQPQPESDRDQRSEVRGQQESTLTPETVGAAIAEALQGIEKRIEATVEKRLKYHLGKVD